MNEKDEILQTFLKIFEVCSWGSNWQLFEVMAWHGTGDKPLPEPIMTKFCDTYVSSSTNILIEFEIQTLQCSCS